MKEQDDLKEKKKNNYENRIKQNEKNRYEKEKRTMQEMKLKKEKNERKYEEEKIIEKQQQQRINEEKNRRCDAAVCKDEKPTEVITKEGKVRSQKTLQQHNPRQMYEENQ